jgi:integrase
LSTQEIERLWDALDKYSNQSVANAILLMLLTGARKSEALTARWEDFNLDLLVWTKPSHHTKQKRTEHVPLSAPAVQHLASMKEKADGNAHLFPGDVAEQPLNEIKWAWAKLCKGANRKRANP